MYVCMAIHCFMIHHPLKYCLTMPEIYRLPVLHCYQWNRNIYNMFLLPEETPIYKQAMILLKVDLY